MNPTPVLLASAAAVLALIAAPPAAAAEVHCAPVKLTCGGFEPNWNFELAEDGTMKFTDPENPDWQTKPLTVKACAQVATKGFIIKAGAPLDLSANVIQKRCVEPNDKVRPYSISIKFKQGATGSNPHTVSGTGCCWK